MSGEVQTNQDKRVEVAALFVPPALLLVLPIVLYGLVRWNAIVLMHPLTMILFLAIWLGCVAAEVLLLPMIMIKISRNPDLQTGANAFAVGLGFLVCSTYPIAFIYMRV